jgi:hypothetical protein
MVAVEMLRELFSHPVMKQVSSVLRQYYTKMNLLEFHLSDTVRAGHRDHSRHWVHFKKFLYCVQRTHNLIDKTYCMPRLHSFFISEPEVTRITLAKLAYAVFLPLNKSESAMECRFAVATDVLHSGAGRLSPGPANGRQIYECSVVE